MQSLETTISNENWELASVCLLLGMLESAMGASGAFLPQPAEPPEGGDDA